MWGRVIREKIPENKQLLLNEMATFQLVTRKPASHPFPTPGARVLKIGAGHTLASEWFRAVTFDECLL
jgi:hypothetical protein